MPAQLVTYDLHRPGRNYPELFDAIKSTGSGWWHCFESVWIVLTPLSSAQVREALQPHVDANDSLAVFGLNGNWATLGIGQECNDWLRTHL